MGVGGKAPSTVCFGIAILPSFLWGKSSKWTTSLGHCVCVCVCVCVKAAVHSPDGSGVMKPPANAGDSSSVPESGRSLGQKDPLEKGMATHSIILA